MENIQTADFSFILYVIIAIVGVIIKISQESRKKGNRKSSNNLNIDFDQILKSVDDRINPKPATQNYREAQNHDYSDHEMMDSLEKHNNNIYDTVQDLRNKKKAVELIEDNIEINEKGRYELYSMRQRKKSRNKYGRMLKTKNGAKQAFIASQIFERKF